jgi:hypothetical protein
MWYACDRKECFTRCRWEVLRERDLLEDRSVDGRMQSEWIISRLAMGCCVGSIGSE